MSTREDREEEVRNGEHADEPEREYDRCETCDEAGYVDTEDDYFECPDCHGEGRIDITDDLEEPSHEPQTSFL